MRLYGSGGVMAVEACMPRTRTIDSDDERAERARKRALRTVERADAGDALDAMVQQSIKLHGA